MIKRHDDHDEPFQQVNRRYPVLRQCVGHAVAGKRDKGGCGLIISREWMT
jgi:hypothetical protein